jgi:hypothetical protein
MQHHDIGHAGAHSSNEVEESAMLTHVVVYSLQDGVSADEVVARLQHMISLAPLVTTVAAGVDVSRSHASYDVALITTHPDAECYESYRTHPDHKVLLDWLLPKLENRTVVDFLS